MVAPFLPEPEKVAAVREALPATGAGIYLNTASVGPLPAETAKAMADLAEWETRVGRGHPDDAAETEQRLDEARAAVAAVLGADVDAIALTHSTTDGLNAALWSLDWRPGDRAVTTREEHPGLRGPLAILRRRFGVEVVEIELDADDEALVERFDEAIRPGARLVALSHVTWLTGRRLPVERIAPLAATRGATVVVDGAQAVGALPVDAPSLGADFYALPAYKWLLGPQGMGALWVAPRVVAAEGRQLLAGRPSFALGDEAGAVDPSVAFWPTARRFEWSTFHRPSVLGFARSCSWLSMYVGLGWMFERGARLTELLAGRLASIRGVELLAAGRPRGTILALRVAGWRAPEVARELGQRAFAIVQPVPALDAVRLSVGFFNTEAELERVAETVELLAEHRPETLPPRPSLTVLGGEPAGGR